MTETGKRIPDQNQVFLVGRLTRDTEIRFTQKGQAMCRFDIAVNRRYQNKATGDWVEDTTFIPLVAWSQVAESMREQVKKGTAVRIEGRLQGREYEDKTGAKRKILEVRVWKIEVLAATAKSAGKPAPKTSQAAAPANSEEDLEEVPF